MSTHPQVNIVEEDKDAGLANYHYDMDVDHSDDIDRWKGIIMDTTSNRVHAMSFPWAETLVAEHVPSDMIYFRHRESSILRFYVGPDGNPRISTHRRIDISNTNTRVHTGKPFIQLVKQAIRNWPYVDKMESHLVDPSMGLNPNISAEDLAYAPQASVFRNTPQKWQDLCIPGYCHVFLLVDISNQITDDSNLKEVTEIVSIRDIEEEPDLVFIGPDGEIMSETFSEGSRTREATIIDTIEETKPELIYAISYKANTVPSSDGIYWMTPFRGPIQINHPTPLVKIAYNDRGEEMRDPETGELVYDIGHGANITIYEMPSLDPLSAQDADDILRMGSAVVGFSDINSDQSIKFYSSDYAYKIDLVGDTFNPIHRWHQLMDINPGMAEQYLNIIPWHLKPITQDMMLAKHTEYMDHAAAFLSKLIIDDINKRPDDNDIYSRLWNKPGVKDIMLNVRAQAVKQRITDPKKIAPTLEKMLREDLSYTEFHNLHGTIMKMSKVEDYYTYIVSFLANLVMTDPRRETYVSIWNDSSIRSTLDDAAHMARSPNKHNLDAISNRIGLSIKRRFRTHDQYHALYTSIVYEEHLNEIILVLAELIMRKMRTGNGLSKLDQELWDRPEVSNILSDVEKASRRHMNNVNAIASLLRPLIQEKLNAAEVHSFYDSLRH